MLVLHLYRMYRYSVAETVIQYQWGRSSSFSLLLADWRPGSSLSVSIQYAVQYTIYVFINCCQGGSPPPPFSGRGEGETFGGTGLTLFIRRAGVRGRILCCQTWNLSVLFSCLWTFSPLGSGGKNAGKLAPALYTKIEGVSCPTDAEGCQLCILYSRASRQTDLQTYRNTVVTPLQGTQVKRTR